MARMTDRTARLTLTGTDTVAAEVLALSAGHVRWAAESDRDDVAQTVAMFALDILNGPDGATFTTARAVAIGATRARYAYTEDSAVDAVRAVTVDMTDAATVATLEDVRTRIDSWTPTAPDHMTVPDRSDVLEAIFCVMEATAMAGAMTDWDSAESAFRRVAVMRAAVESIRTRGPLPAALDSDAIADMTDAAHAVLTRDAHRYGTAKHDGWTSATAALADTLRHHSRGHGVAPFGLPTFTPRAYAQVIGADGALESYRPTTTQAESDRAADAFAEATTPVGAVVKPSGVKRKRDGSVGASMVTGRKGWAERNVSSRV